MRKRCRYITKNSKVANSSTLWTSRKNSSPGSDTGDAERPIQRVITR
jgi:hypothetical protein